MTGANPSTSAGLKRIYKAHVQRYANICAYNNIQFHPLAFDTLGRAHKSTVGDIAHLFTTRDKRVDLNCWPTRKVLRVLADGLHRFLTRALRNLALASSCTVISPLALASSRTEIAPFTTLSSTI